VGREGSGGCCVYETWEAARAKRGFVLEEESEGVKRGRRGVGGRGGGVREKGRVWRRMQEQEQK